MTEIELPKRIIKSKNQIGQIYIIKNTVNNKVYIGETTMGYKKRFAQHCKHSTRSNRHYKLYEAMNSLGVENFYLELLEDNISIDRMYEREIFYIKKFNSFSNGYNSTKGGNGRLINTTENIEYIISEYNKGRTTGDIAKDFNVTWSTIDRTLKRYDVPLRKDGSKIFLINKDEFIKMWNDGVVISEMAKYFSLNEKTVRRYVVKLNLKLRGKGFQKNVKYKLKKEDIQPTLFD